MTNGEKIQNILNVDRDCTEVHGENGTMTFTVTQDFWNAEYKEPTTKNNLAVDCISRADAIKAMQEKAKRLTNEDTINGLCGAVAILFDLPSVTPQEPKTGHWIKCDILQEFKCSKCRVCFRNKSNYCPNCGAKMVEPQESEG